jgi:nitrogen fixation protein FixH
MKFGKYNFESFQQFQSVQGLAVENGYETAEEFNEFLETNYSYLKK